MAYQYERKPREIHDPVTFEVIRNILTTVSDEMAVMVMRSARSSIVRDLLDFATALCDQNGRLIAQGLSLPLHLGSIPDAIKAVRAAFGHDFTPGDIIILNDPYHGGMHLPDIFMFKPVFYEKELVGFASVVAHHSDIGGRVPGSGAADSTEIFQEGIRIPPLKLHAGGIHNRSVYDLLSLNVRMPHLVLADLEAQIAGCRIGELGLLQLYSGYGKATANRYIDSILDYSERMTREEIRQWPKGVYEFTDYEDHDGLNAAFIPIHVLVHVGEDGVRFDFTGSSPQVKGAINCTPSFARSAVYIAVRSLMHISVPNNEGCFRPIEVVLPEGSILNPRPPAACAARGVVGYRILDAIFGAMAQCCPERVPAAGDGGVTGIRIGGYYSDGSAFQFNDIISGSWGARFDMDGVEGLAHLATNISNQPIEVLETENPVRVLKYGFVPDSGGAGRYRGGLALVRQLEFLSEEAVLQVRSHRRHLPPYGLHGGQEGSTSRTHLYRDGKEVELEAKVTTRLMKGDCIRHITAGGGGIGDPIDRDPHRVLNDVLDEKLSQAYAERVYGVVLDKSGTAVDALATARRRAELRTDIRTGQFVRDKKNRNPITR